MDTPTNNHLVLANTTTDQPGRGQRFAAWLRRARRAAGQRIPAGMRNTDNWINAAFAGAVIGAILALLVAAIWLIVAILNLISDAIIAVGHGASHVGSGAWRWITHGPITHTISDPVRSWLDTHTSGLAATSGQLWTLWLVAVGVLFVAAVFGSTYGRIGWALIGALTAYAVWHGSPAGARPVAVGVTAAVWLVLSVVAYTRRYKISWPLAGRVLHRPEPTPAAA